MCDISAMSSYRYSFLPPDTYSIRLLRLLPNEDEAAPLHCKLCNYSMQRSNPRTHMYEAFSYVWGDPDKTLPIRVEEDRFEVTVNLHAALLRLRDHSFERIIWVDAICIDQSNNEERKQQVQLMAKIYSNAYRVIVWFGEQGVEIEGALENIRLAAADELVKQSKKEINQEAIINLLQNPWFQRIWVLQEVAAARHVLMMCGSTTIDGHAFCLGVKSLKLSYMVSPELQTLPSVIYLIERAGLRSKNIESLPGRFSLEIRSLAELIDMFHTRQASDIRDKVYALLGMSSDDSDKAVLQPDYEISWDELFEQLVKFIFGEDVSVETSSQRALIKCKGCILGQVFSVRTDGDRQYVNIISKNGAWERPDREIEWTLQASTKPIQMNDIICLPYGASKPTIIRLYKDHFAIAIVAATPLNESSNFEWSKLSHSTARFLRDFLLIWDWESSPEKLRSKEEYQTLEQIYSQVPVSSQADPREYLSEVEGLWNDIAILDDLKEYYIADKRLLAARHGYLAAFGGGRGDSSEYGRTLLSNAAGEGHEEITKLLLDTVHPDIRDGRLGETPLWWAAHNGHEAIVRLLLGTGKVEADSQDKYGQTPLWCASSNGHGAIVKLLLETGNVNADSRDKWGTTPLSQAAMNGHEAIVKLLLETGKVDVNSKGEFDRTPLLWAAGEGYDAIVKLLLETNKVDINSKDTKQQTSLLLAARKGHQAVVKLLLETGKVDVNTKDKQGITPYGWASINGDEAVIRLLFPRRKMRT